MTFAVVEHVACAVLGAAAGMALWELLNRQAKLEEAEERWMGR